MKSCHHCCSNAAVPRDENFWGADVGNSVLCCGTMHPKRSSGRITGKTLRTVIHQYDVSGVPQRSIGTVSGLLAIFGYLSVVIYQGALS